MSKHFEKLFSKRMLSITERKRLIPGRKNILLCHETLDKSVWHEKLNPKLKQFLPKDHKKMLPNNGVLGLNKGLVALMKEILKLAYPRNVFWVRSCTFSMQVIIGN